MTEREELITIVNKMSPLTYLIMDRHEFERINPPRPFSRERPVDVFKSGVMGSAYGSVLVHDDLTRDIVYIVKQECGKDAVWQDEDRRLRHHATGFDGLFDPTRTCRACDGKKVVRKCDCLLYTSPSPRD